MSAAEWLHEALQRVHGTTGHRATQICVREIGPLLDAIAASWSGMVMPLTDEERQLPSFEGVPIWCDLSLPPGEIMFIGQTNRPPVHETIWVTV
jgi:hypothetical protein